MKKLAYEGVDRVSADRKAAMRKRSRFGKRFERGLESVADTSLYVNREYSAARLDVNPRCRMLTNYREPSATRFWDGGEVWLASSRFSGRHHRRHTWAAWPIVFSTALH